MKIVLELDDVGFVHKLRAGLIELSDSAHDCWSCGGGDEMKDEEDFFNKLQKQIEEQLEPIYGCKKSKV